MSYILIEEVLEKTTGVKHFDICLMNPRQGWGEVETKHIDIGMFTK